MTTKSYRGDAPAIAKVVTIPRPVAYTGGRITVTINNKKISNDSWNATVIADLWNNSGYPETANVFATAGEDTSSAYGVSFAPLIFTSLVPGEDFFINCYIGDEDSINITNEVQLLNFYPEPDTGTFTLSFSGQTTGAITYVAGNAGQTAANILAALEALSNIAPGDVVVSYNGADPTSIGSATYRVAFAGAYVNVNVAQLVITNVDMTYDVEGVVSVSTSQVGQLPIDEVQTLSLPVTPTGGDFTLTYAGQTTAAIAWNAAASAVQSALEALSNIAVGDVICTGGALPGTPVVITFAANLGDQDIALITGDGTNLTGGSDNVDSFTEVQAGAVTVPQTDITLTYINNPVHWTSETSVFFTFKDKAGSIVQTTPVVYSTLNAAAIKALFVGKTIRLIVDPYSGTTKDYVITTDDIDVTGSLGPSSTLVISYKQRLASPQNISINVDGDASGTFAAPISMSVYNPSTGFYFGRVGYFDRDIVRVEVQMEKQSYRVVDITIPGQYTLTVYDTAGSPHTTAAINYSELDPNVIRQRINTALGGDYVSVFGPTLIGGSGDDYEWRIDYYAYEVNRTNITLMSGNEGSVSVLETTKGDPGLSEIQVISVAVPVGADSSGGSFTLTYDGQTTSSLDFDATAGEILIALEALSNIAVGDIISVSGSLASTITVVFDELLGNVNPLELDVDGLTVDVEVTSTLLQAGGLEIFFLETTRNQGPECFDDPLNYDPVGVPSDGDDVNFEYGRAACRWGIKQRDTFTVLSTSTELLQLGTKRPLFQDGQKVLVTSTTTAPGGLASGTAYFVVNMDQRGRFQLSTTEGGAPINITDAGTGTHTIGLRLGVFKKPARYEFDIGLTRQNSSGFIEYRPRYLEVYATQFILGEGQGNDSNLTRLDTGTVAIASGIQIYGTGSSNESSLPAAALLINNSAVDIKCYGGDVGLAPHLDEAAVINDIEMYDTQLSSVGQVTCRNITGDEGSTIRGRFLPSGTIKLGV